MYYVILVLLAVVGFLLFLQLLVRMDVTKLARGLRYAGAGVCFLIGLYLTLTGRFYLAIPVVLFGIGMLGRSSMLSGFPFGAGQKSGQQNSRVRTSLIEMTLEHDTGEMDGRVLAGDFEGRILNGMTLDELGALYDTALNARDQSADLLETFLDRYHQDWLDQPAFKASAGTKGKTGTGSSGPMSREEAFEVLGVQPGVDDEAIREAHKKLMKKLHPDQGGSGYLAAKLNEAKDTLLSQ